MRKDFLLGNGAIALGLLESGCEVITAYPGTPSSEIVPEVIKFVKSENLDTYVEWSVNEKIAFDNAFAASITGKRSACCMKQVGLNVASDSLMSSAYLGTKGGFIIISCDDPGPHSSQTEQDTRMMARLAKIPVFDPSSPDEARKMLKYAFEISEQFEIPVIVRPTTRICHTKQIIKWTSIKKGISKKAIFTKNPTRWASTPKYRFKQHKILNRKLNEIEKKFDSFDSFNYSNFCFESNKIFPVGIITSGFVSTIVSDLLKNKDDIPVLNIGTPYPLPKNVVENFLKNCEKILVLEETDSLLEYLISRKEKVFGRISGHVPSEGELIPEKVEKIINEFLLANNLKPITKYIESNLFKKIRTLKLPDRKPSLCAGCPHRASFFAIRKAQPKAIFTSDIGCYTLGMNMGSVDTCVDMGAAITIASGFYQSFNKDNQYQSIIATIGDSTFIHSGTSGLINAVYNRAKFVLVILDNGIIAMTGMQPSPTSGILASGKKGNHISLERVVKGCGVDFIKTIDPYKIKSMITTIKEAINFTLQPEGGMAVIIARHPCLVASKANISSKNINYYVNEKCDGCNFCHNRFQCPALYKHKSLNKSLIDKDKCVKCGICKTVCAKNAIIEESNSIA